MNDWMRWICVGAFFVVVSGCGVFRAPHAWLQPDARFVYRFENAGAPFVAPTYGFAYPDADSALVLRVQEAPYRGVLLRYHYAAWAADSITHVDAQIAVDFAGLTGTGRSPERTRRGVVVSFPESCGGGIQPVDPRPTRTFVRVPASPDVGDTVPVYRCGPDADAEFTVTDVDAQVTVPAGTFEVFVMQSDALRQREYWSEAVGLIRVDRLYDDGATLGTYQLQSRRPAQSPP